MELDINLFYLPIGNTYSFLELTVKLQFWAIMILPWAAGTHDIHRVRLPKLTVKTHQRHDVLGPGNQQQPDNGDHNYTVFEGVPTGIVIT